MASDLIVIGAGAIGLSVARELAPDHSVLLLEKGSPGRQSSWAAAGMLSPHGEAETDGPLFRFGVRSLAMFPRFVQELREETGVDPEYRDEGTLILASTERERADLAARARWQNASGFDTCLIDPDEVRLREMSLRMETQGALFCPRDHQIRPRRLLEGLRKSCVIRGVTIRSGARVEEILVAAGRVSGVRSQSGQVDRAPAVVVAAGAWSGLLKGAVPAVPTRPRKGQILDLEVDGGDFRHVVRWRQFYCVPRSSGELVIGATNEDCGFDRRLTSDGVGQLLDAACRLVGGDISRIGEMWTGLRPGTPDGLPAIGPYGIPGLYCASGHYRDGILLTPATSQILGSLLRGEKSGHVDAAPFSPMRFAAPGLAGKSR